MADAAIWIFALSEFGTFRHDGNLVVELSAKFGGISLIVPDIDVFLFPTLATFVCVSGHAVSSIRPCCIFGLPSKFGAMITWSRPTNAAIRCTGHRPTVDRVVQELSYRKQIGRQLRTQYVDGSMTTPW